VGRVVGAMVEFVSFPVSLSLSLFGVGEVMLTRADYASQPDCHAGSGGGGRRVG